MTTMTTMTTKKTIAKRLMSSGLTVISALCWSTAHADPVVLPSDISTDWTCTGSCGSLAGADDIALSPTGNAKYGYVTTSESAETGVSPLSLDPTSRGTGIETNGSKIVSSSFTAGQGDVLSIYFNYVSTDGKGYDDYAWARLLNASDNSFVAWLFTAESTNSGTKNIVPGKVVDKNVFDPDTAIENFKDYSFTSKPGTDAVDWAALGASNGTCWKDDAAGCGYTGWLKSTHTMASGGNFRVEFGVVNWGDGAYDSGLAFDFTNLSASAVVPPPPGADIPEPATPALLALALGVMGGTARRRRSDGH